MRIQTKLNYHYLKQSCLSRLYPNRNPYKKSSSKRVWIFLGADYGNLGDIAITLCQEQLLRQQFPGYEIISVPISKTISDVPYIKRIIDDEDIVTIVGGGNMSDLYEDIEYLRQLVIKAFPNNRIISFPQSIYLTDSTNGEYAKRQIAKVYSSHKDLLILMRDRVSFQRLKRILPDANIKLAPDVVMTTDFRQDLPRKKKVFICLRNDKETTKSGHNISDAIIQGYRAKGYEIVKKDTQIADNLVEVNCRKTFLNEFLDEVKTSSLMITNRLHGMIFAFITGTPAIVMDNSTGKVSSTYEWIKDCGYIDFVAGNNLSKHSERKPTNNFNKVSSRINQLLRDAIK